MTHERGAFFKGLPRDRLLTCPFDIGQQESARPVWRQQESRVKRNWECFYPLVRVHPVVAPSNTRFGSASNFTSDTSFDNGCTGTNLRTSSHARGSAESYFSSLRFVHFDGTLNFFYAFLFVFVCLVYWFFVFM